MLKLTDGGVFPRKTNVRFLLTFDDGPDTSLGFNPTVSILEQLEKNSVQHAVKALFFVQTRNVAGGGSQYGRHLLRREHREGHVLGLHTGTVRGHVNHRRMKPEELQQSLADGIHDLQEITGEKPLFVRPPFWSFDSRTLFQYSNNGLRMILSDVKSYDGIHWIVLARLRRNILRFQLARVRSEITQRLLPTVGGGVPVVVTFHDTNSFTATHMGDYLQILVEEAGRMGLPLDERPFYDNRSEVERSGIERAINHIQAGASITA
ncbi:MAG: polysaccharide deacetylase family protein [Nitrospiraceae bacterium]